MVCPSCHGTRHAVIATTDSRDGREVIRRRLCSHCAHRWTTRELHANRLQTPVPKRVPRRQPST